MLLDVEHDYEVFRWIEDYDAEFNLDGKAGITIGIEPRGMFILKVAQHWIDKSSPLPRRTHEVFRAVLIEQRLLEPERTELHDSGLVEYVNLDTGTLFRCNTAVSGRQIPWPNGKMEDTTGRVRTEYPRMLEVVVRERTAANYAYIIDPLKRVFTA